MNHLAIIRAFVQNLASGEIESGASTITQQYVKLAFLTPEQTYQRKIQEALYAVQIERQLTKDEILERYLNRAHFGVGTYGIGTAAQRFLSRDVSDVTLDQAAMLAGILRSPSNNNPISDPENARERRDIVLGQMASAGFITREEAEAAQARPLRVAFSEPPVPDQPFWSDWGRAPARRRGAVRGARDADRRAASDGRHGRGASAAACSRPGCASRRRSTPACRASPRRR